MSATDEARKLRAQDLAATAAEHAANPTTRVACDLIRQIQVFEEDALVLLHTLMVQIERSGNMHIPHWPMITETLGDVQEWLDVEIRERNEWEGK